MLVYKLLYLNIFLENCETSGEELLDVGNLFYFCSVFSNLIILMIMKKVLHMARKESHHRFLLETEGLGLSHRFSVLK